MAFHSSNSSADLTISPGQFYGCCTSFPSKRSKSTKDLDYVLSSSKVGSAKEPLPFRFNRLSGPSQTWKVFKKQKDALTCAKTRKSGLMTFAFQQSTGDRLFLVAHPQVFWFYDCTRLPSQRCSYEIIPEHSVSKLYFDLEFDIVNNPNSVGNEMVETFISVVSYFIDKVFEIKCNRNNIVDLDSTTKIKFSRHLIFHLPCAIFKNNCHVGNFVKYVCNEIWAMCNFSPISVLGSNKQSTNKSISEEFTNLRTLVVNDNKGQLKLFCDEAVYSKNRHFRLFHSTKFGKNAPLLLSTQNKFCSSGGSTDSNFNELMFLSSLVTYVTTEMNENVKILEFFNTKISNNRKCKDTVSDIVSNAIQTTNSPYLFIDNFIEKLVSPGHIWRSAFFTTTDVIVYDIVGYRYCGNIEREHRSNNIKYIVDIKQCCYYQKCYDPDCSKYRSQVKKLPPELCFMLEDDTEFIDSYSSSALGNFDMDLYDEDLLEVLSILEDVV